MPRSVMAMPVTECSASCRANTLPARLVLGAQALRIWAFGQLACKRGHADRFRMIGFAPQVDAVLRLLFRLGAIADAGHHEGARKLGMPHAEMQGGKAAHRQPDDVRRLIRDRAHHIGEIVGRALLAIGIDRRRYVRWRVAARAIDRAAKIAREMTRPADPSFAHRRKIRERERAVRRDRSNEHGAWSHPMR